MATERVDGVVLSLDDARYLVQALDELSRLGAASGAVASAKLQTLTSHLRKITNASQTQANTSSNASDQWFEPDWGNHVGYGATITPAEAAELLGCSAANVRDLAQRGSIRARRVGGRWQISHAAVLDRAAHSHDATP